MTTLWKTLFHHQLFQKCLTTNIIGTSVIIPNREKSRKPNIPKKRHPEWLPKQTRALCDDNITSENKEFIQEVIESKYIQPGLGYGMDSPLKTESLAVTSEWNKDIRRTGVIGKKIGVYPMWLKNGKKVNTTLLQIVDNHVVKYLPPEEFTPVKRGKHLNCKNKKGSLIVGADSADPQLFTKEYCSLFNASGVMPKRVMHRFIISPEAALPPGTPLFAAHFQAGDVVDIRGKTVDRGFQGVMKRWGFKGMRATHGTTKTHRRPGNIGSGGAKARVMPGTKMPGHMGNRWRVIRGYRILRVNTKYNVIWVMGHNIPGETNTYCHIYDTLLPLRKHTKPPHFPTYLPGVSPPVEEESYVEDVHSFKDPTIEHQESSKQ